MKRILIVVVGVAIVGALSAATLFGVPAPWSPMIASKRFVWQQPLPQGNPIRVVDFVTDTLGWAAGDNGTVLKTTDGGFSWTNQGPIVPQGGSDRKTGVFDACFVDATHGWIAADTMVYRTTDGGSTWSDSGAWMTDMGGNYLAYTAVDFADADNGWMIGSGHVFQTTNGGVTVTEQTIPGGLNVSEVQAVSSTTAFAYRYTTTGFLVTENGGNTWEQRTFTGTAYENRGPYGFAACTPSLIYAQVGLDLLKSTNGGSTWTTQTVTSLDLGDDPYMVYTVDGDASGSRVYVLSDGGDLHASSDGGATWEKRQEHGSLYSLDAPSSTSVFAVKSSRVKGSTDGGGTWYDANGGETTHPYIAVDFTSETTGNAITPYAYARTSDGGANWDVRSLATLGINLTALGDMTFLGSDPSIGWIAGTPPYGSPTVYKTVDSGETWTSLEETTMVGIGTLRFSDANNGWALYSYQDGFWHSSDGGNSWQLVPHAGSHWDLDWADAEHGWISYSPMDGTDLCVARTVDGGSTWTTQTVGHTGGSLLHIDFADEQTGYAVDSMANIFKTTNGGETWNEFAFWPWAPDFSIDDINFSTPLDGWVVGQQLTSSLSPTKRHDFAAHTTDGGMTWDFNADSDSSDKGSTGTNVTPYAVDAVGSRMWFVGGNGSILASRPRPVTTLTSTSKTLSTYGQSTAVSGVLKVDGAPLPGRRVDLYTCSTAGGTYVKTNSGATTASNGTFSITVRPTSTTYYKVRSAVDATTQASASSASVKIVPRPAVGSPHAPSSMRRSTYYTVYGYLKPKHTAGTYPVRIYLWRYVSGSWRSYGYVKAKAANYSSYTKYSTRMRLTSSGKWRLRAYHPADAGQASAWSSSYDYVTVP